VAHAIVENALNATRLAKTVVAARRFSRARVTPDQTEGQSQFNMRSGMSLDPRIGKVVSRISIRERNPLAWQIADVTTSSFIDPAEIDAAVAGVRANGFYVFDRVADTAITDAIRAYAEQVPCVARGAGTPPEVYPRSSPQVGRYDIEETEALGCAEVQDFATDPALALVAQKYLNQPVIMDEVAFWWTTNKRAEDANLNAQMFHQDRDRLSFLKFFIYLTDVTTDTGPHIYLRESHRSIPWSLRPDGRMTDEAVHEAGLWGNVTELTGPAGTIMAVDTIGLHKGKTPIIADRLALENEFSTSLFGMDYERPEFTPTERTKARFAQMPWVLQRYSGPVSRTSR
jgi:Phytanoyl-CoA dioxygenase (PhyH)